jgi:PKD repeat protein
MVSITVLGNHPPDLSTASASPSVGKPPLLVHFDASGVTDPDGNKFTLSWDFGDKSPVSSTAKVDHTYSTEGTYIATLTAQDDGTPAVPPATRSFTIKATSVPITNQPPDCAAATITPLEGKAPLTVTLDASGCKDPDGDALTFLWHVPTSMMTEDTYTTAQATATLAKPGVLTVKLDATDSAAQPMTTTREFTVKVADETGVVPGGGGGSMLMGGCTIGATASAALSLPLLVVLGLLIWRGRRRPRG